ncbi:DUF5711 family protein [Clostridium aminobutyricum]|uniref:Prolow-density lipoprotein receptor-related protein 1-like beta-propeller domain-containing protein n=1 Tax=Clostridium aminobutyricum TaxID=33953 RepID=A0A939D6K1_CLOAM|nr:DUF5050 domain-containing protein [Clostridium aminobutyricum]MBN7771995.1 hypothetical protein [Clostridium aminobutyricum]
MRRKLMIFIALFILVGSHSIFAFGAQKTNAVAVSLPNFNVTMNGEVVNNDYSKYPLIVYKNITYFPMTYSDCRFLGIESTWKGNTQGLTIEKTGVTAAYQLYKSSAKNSKNYTATIPTFPVKVNGKIIDNSKEEFPLLSFRDITYFPMTWKYGAEAFGWDYSFDNKKGLVIHSDNIKLSQISLPTSRPVQGEYAPYPGKRSNCVLPVGDYVYYDDTKGAIIQAPLSAPSKGKKVYQLNVWSYGDGTTYDDHSLYLENGEPFLFFHSGGAVMGSDHKHKLKADGSTQEIQSSYWQTTLIGDTLFYYWTGPTPGPGNLRMQEGSSEDIQLGDSGYWYYSLCKVYGLPELTRIGDELYVRAAKVLSGTSLDANIKLDDIAIYKVNIKTKETARVSTQYAQGAQISDDFLYYFNSENFYRISLKDGTEERLGAATGISNSDSNGLFAVAGEKIYWTNAATGELHMLGKTESLNPGAKVDSMGIFGDKEEYFVCTFEETQASKYRLMVFDQSGKVVFKTSDKTFCNNISIKGNQIMFYNNTTETICKGNW